MSYELGGKSRTAFRMYCNSRYYNILKTRLGLNLSRGSGNCLKLFNDVGYTDWDQQLLVTAAKTQNLTAFKNVESDVNSRRALSHEDVNKIIDFIYTVCNSPKVETDEELYKKACELMNSPNYDDYKKAADIFGAIHYYADSETKQKVAENNYQIINREEKEKLSKEIIKKTIKYLIIMLILAAIAVPTGIFFTNKNKQDNYNSAVELFNNGEFASAYVLFDKLGDYKDSAEYKEKAYPGYYKSQLANHVVGDVLEFGVYGNADLEWIVIDKTEDKMLLLLKYGLGYENVAYHKANSFTWETSSTRSWLNSSFYNDTFSSLEKDIILISDVTADKNPNYSTEQGNDTKDKVFLLSVLEAQKYFASDDDRKCTFKPNGNWCYWWLRTNGSDSKIETLIDGAGRISYPGWPGDNIICALRPAVWIDTSN